MTTLTNIDVDQDNLPTFKIAKVRGRKAYTLTTKNMPSLPSQTILGSMASRSYLEALAQNAYFAELGL